jgi:hypothetical protein
MAMKESLYSIIKMGMESFVWDIAADGFAGWVL